MKIAGMVLLLVALPSLVFGGFLTAPEIDAPSGVGALALLSGAFLVIRGRRKKQ